MPAPAAEFRLPDTQNQAWSKDASRFGARMLQQMGWKEGRGLGKKEDGAVAHVKVEKRRDALGLGAQPASAGGEAALSAAISDYDSLLQSLAASATGAGAGGVGGRKRARSCSDAGSEPAAAAAAAAPTRIIGRFAHHRVLRQKNVAAYSKEDLRAVLGTHALAEGGATGGAGAAAALPCAPAIQHASLSETARERRERKEAKREKKQRKREEQARVAEKAAKKEARRKKREEGR
jgi:hypothetical protein